MFCANWRKHETHSLQAWKTRFWQTWNAASIKYLTGKSKEYDQYCCCFSCLFFVFFQSSVVKWMATIHNKIEPLFHIEELCSILQCFQLPSSKSSKIFHLFKENFRKWWKKPFKSSLFHVFFTVLINSSWRCKASPQKNWHDTTKLPKTTHIYIHTLALFHLEIWWPNCNIWGWYL
jgi:hypothetical protein